MKPRWLRITALVLILNMSLSSVSFAWSRNGHRLIARIAWTQLTPKERATIVGLLRQNPNQEKLQRKDAAGQEDEALFVEAAAWPDMVRDEPKYNRPLWHFINKPYFLTEDDKKALSGKPLTNLSTEP